jgi:anthranilate phosphoribosyltransferase
LRRRRVRRSGAIADLDSLPYYVSVLELLIQRLSAREHLTESQVSQAVAQLVDESVSVDMKADFLVSLARKGETGPEIAVFARELRARAIQPAINGALRSCPILDVVGTGGDRLNTFNISTASALVAAAGGVVVAKHGNRASTSSTGSADVLEALGIPWNLGPEEAVRSLERHKFAFFFAPKYHPAFRHIIPARKLCAERGQSTIFNILGPLLNPACPSATLVGVPRPELCEALAAVLKTLGLRRAMIVCGTARDETGAIRYLDELSPLGPTHIAEFYQENGLNASKLAPDAFPVQTGGLADLRGGDPLTNARIIRGIFAGHDRGIRRDAVLLNAAAALFVAEKARTLAEGWDRAAEIIDSGLAARKVKELSAT